MPRKMKIPTIGDMVRIKGRKGHSKVKVVDTGIEQVTGRPMFIYETKDVYFHQTMYGIAKLFGSKYEDRSGGSGGTHNLDNLRKTYWRKLQGKKSINIFTQYREQRKKKKN